MFVASFSCLHYSALFMHFIDCKYRVAGSEGFSKAA